MYNPVGADYYAFYDRRLNDDCGRADQILQANDAKKNIIYHYFCFVNLVIFLYILNNNNCSS